MISRTTSKFRRAYRQLPQHIQRRAREAYQLFADNPSHPSLRFKQVHPTKPIYSVRITLAYRALGVREGSEIVWFWIGTHADYESLIYSSPSRVTGPLVNLALWRVRLASYQRNAPAARRPTPATKGSKTVLGAQLSQFP